MPFLVVRHRRYLSWLVPLLLIAYILLLWAGSRGEDRFAWFTFIYPLMFSWRFQPLWGKSEYLLTDGVLAPLQGFYSLGQMRVPLAAVTRLQHKGRRIRLDWKSGRVGRSATLRVPEELIPPLEQAIEAARAAQPGSLPMTDAEARKAVQAVAVVNQQVERWVGVTILAALFIPVALSFWLNEPLILLPLALTSVLAERANRVPRLLLVANQLYVLSHQGALRPIPLESVQALISGPGGWTIQTTDPDYPMLTIRLIDSSDLAKQLKRLLSGDALPTHVPVTDAGAASQPLRCSLCGRPAPSGAPAPAQGLAPAPGATAPASGIPTAGVPAGEAPALYICPTCSNRTRLEATDAGHGLSSKETKPM